MKESTLRQAIELAKSLSGPFCEIVAASTRAGAIQLSEVEPRLDAAEYKTEYRDANNGSWARVLDKGGALAAQGYSSDGRDDAFLHALWGAVREEHAHAHVDAALEKAGLSRPSDDVYLKLEQAFILQGPDELARLVSGLKR